MSIFVGEFFFNFWTFQNSADNRNEFKDALQVMRIIKCLTQNCLRNKRIIYERPLKNFKFNLIWSFSNRKFHVQFQNSLLEFQEISFEGFIIRIQDIISFRSKWRKALIKLERNCRDSSTQNSSLQSTNFNFFKL